jgi:hypothetical protein
VIQPPEGKPLPGEPQTTAGEAFAGLISAAITFGFVWLCVATYKALFQTVFGRPVYLIAFVATGLCALGIAVYVLRDLRKSKTVATIQVGIAIAAGTVSTFGAETLALKALAALAALVVIANGLNKLLS